MHVAVLFKIVSQIYNSVQCIKLPVSHIQYIDTYTLACKWGIVDKLMLQDAHTQVHTLSLPLSVSDQQPLVLLSPQCV